MENLTRVELMLVKGCIFAEKQSLEAKLESAEKGSMSSVDITNYAYNKNLLMQYETILKKLS